MISRKREWLQLADRSHPHRTGAGGKSGKSESACCSNMKSWCIWWYSANGHAQSPIEPSSKTVGTGCGMPSWVRPGAEV